MFLPLLIVDLAANAELADNLFGSCVRCECLCLRAWLDFQEVLPSSELLRVRIAWRWWESDETTIAATIVSDVFEPNATGQPPRCCKGYALPTARTAQFPMMRLLPVTKPMWTPINVKDISSRLLEPKRVSLVAFYRTTCIGLVGKNRCAGRNCFTKV